MGHHRGIYVLLLFGSIASAFGPPAYMKLNQTGISENFIVAYFLIIGGCSSYLLGFRRNAESILNDIKKRPVAVGVSLTVVGLIWPLYFLAYISAMKEGTITEVSLIVRVSPLIVVFLSVLFLSEKVTSWSGVLLATVLCITGVMILQPQGSTLSFVGGALFLALFVSVLGAISAVLRAYVRSLVTTSGLIIVGVTMIIGGLMLLGYNLLIGEKFVALDSMQWFFVFMLGFGTVALPAQIDLIAFKQLKSQTKVTFFGYIIPIITAIIAFLWNDEYVNYYLFSMAFLLITIGIIVINRSIIHKNP